MLNFIQGSLLDAEEQYIAHQCNCVSKGSAGVARLIFEKFPYSNVYSDRAEPDKIATLKVLGNGEDKRYVINMFSQYYPGPSDDEDELDSALNRKRYFYQCLLLISRIPNLESVAFPYRIGCGLAGGDWKYYMATLNNFSNYLKNVKVSIYCPTQQDFEDAKLDYESLQKK